MKIKGNLIAKKGIIKEGKKILTEEKTSKNMVLKTFFEDFPGNFELQNNQTSLLEQLNYIQIGAGTNPTNFNMTNLENLIFEKRLPFFKGKQENNLYFSSSSVTFEPGEISDKNKIIGEIGFKYRYKDYIYVRILLTDDNGNSAPITLSPQEWLTIEYRLYIDIPSPETVLKTISYKGNNYDITLSNPFIHTETRNNRIINTLLSTFIFENFPPNDLPNRSDFSITTIKRYSDILTSTIYTENEIVLKYDSDLTPIEYFGLSLFIDMSKRYGLIFKINPPLPRIYSETEKEELTFTIILKLQFNN